MIVYWDLVLLTNLIVDYAFLKTLALLYHEKIVWYRLILSLLLGTLSIFLFILPIKYVYNLRYIIGIFMGMIAYNSSKPLKRFLMIISFYLINLVFIGSLVVFEVKNIFFLIVTLIYVMIITILEKIINKNLKTKYEYDVKINAVSLRGLLDTGNNCFYYGKPIVFLKQELFDKNYTYLGKKEIKTIGNRQLIEVYTGPKLTIEKIEYNVLYSFSNIEDYDVILNSIMGE